MAVQNGRVAPGSAYVSGVDAVAITPKRDATHIITVAVSAGVNLLKRVNSVDLLVQALTADQSYTFEWGADDQTPYAIRFSGNCTIRELHVIERRNV